MKLQITIEHFDGEMATYTAAPPEWVKWETKFNKSIQQAEGIGVSDLLFLAYHAMKREVGGKTIKPYEIWIETVSDVKAENADPKDMPSGALVD